MEQETLTIVEKLERANSRIKRPARLTKIGLASMSALSKSSLSAIVVGIALLVLTQSDAAAKNYAIASTTSGSSAQVSIDLDGNNCVTANGLFICPADSALSTDGGNASKGPETGPFTAQDVSEAIPASGTGCSYNPGSIQSCTIGSATDGCLFNYVGGSGVTRNTASGDLSFASLTSGTLCINVNGALPWNFAGQEVWTITGGTGKVSGISGSFTSTFTGQVLQNDPAGHGMSWFASSNTGNAAVP